MLDASHVVYLARGALALGTGPDDAAECLTSALRATSCWEVGRMWTSAMILDEQVDPQLGQLGLAPPSDSGWGEYLSTYSLSNSAPMVAGGVGGRHDDDLLNHVIEEALRQPTLLVTNDEDLFMSARRRFFNDDLVSLSSENSTGMMIKLLRCGAVPGEFVEACLTAEYTNLEAMRSRGMSPAKYERKRHRLEWAVQQLALFRYDDEWSPDHPGD